MDGAMPQIGDKIGFQANPTIAKERTVGIKIADR